MWDISNLVWTADFLIIVFSYFYIILEWEFSPGYGTRLDISC